MHTEKRSISLRPRLDLAAAFLSGCRTAADIGCDHGRLSCALLERNPDMRCIASDVSAPSLEKARRLAELCGVTERIDFRVGDGLSVLADGEAEGLALLGMGGTLMVRLLEAAETPLSGARIAVLQPMRAYADIRRWLWENGYEMVSDRIVRDAGRLYQVFAVRKRPDGTRQTIPAVWPENCFDLGFAAYTDGDPLLPELARTMLLQHEKRLHTAEGTRGAALLMKKAEDMRTVIRLTEGL